MFPFQGRNRHGEESSDQRRQACLGPHWIPSFPHCLHFCPPSPFSFPPLPRIPHPVHCSESGPHVPVVALKGEFCLIGFQCLAASRLLLKVKPGFSGDCVSPLRCPVAWKRTCNYCSTYRIHSCIFIFPLRDTEIRGVRVLSSLGPPLLDPGVL